MPCKDMAAWLVLLGGRGGRRTDIDDEERAILHQKKRMSSPEFVTTNKTARRQKNGMYQLTGRRATLDHQMTFDGGLRSNRISRDEARILPYTQSHRGRLGRQASGNPHNRVGISPMTKNQVALRVR